jgi:imidazolonepropionase
MTDKTPVDLIIHSVDQLLTLVGGRQRGVEFGRLSLIEGGAVAVKGDQIVGVGKTDDLLHDFQASQKLDASGHVILPGFVDPHTHLIWAGDRSSEFEMRVGGASYMEIMDAGGGILSTVRQTRQATLADLIDQTRPRLQRMLEYGTTTAEVKTGYGLEIETELRMLEAILALDEESPLDLVPTFLGAHAIPEEFINQTDAYTDLVCDEMLPAVLDWWNRNARGQALPFVDVFCEAGVFNLEQSRRILLQAQALGFPLKIHVDEFEALGGTDLAVELAAVSADHLVKTPREEIDALGRSNTVAVSLPCTPFGLAENEYTPAGEILKAGGTIAIATDLNPGTAWCESMQFAIALACRYMQITPSQAIVAATINAAAAINYEECVGSIEVGKQADLIFLDVSDYRHLGYRFGTNLVAKTMKQGKIVFERN